jgi:hypothetical protein
MSLDTKLMEKIRKVQIMAEKGTFEEQKVAAEKLQTLLTRHGLSVEDIRPLDNEGNPKPAFTRRIIYGVPNQGWKRDLLHGLCTANLGTSVGQGWRGRSERSKQVGIVVQEKLANEIEQLYHYWVQEIEYLAKQFTKARKRGEVQTDWYYSGKTVMNSYRQGLTDGIVAVIKQAAKEQREQMTEEYTGTSALVLDLEAERDAAIE